MATYSEMVSMVRDYSNRDTEVISNRQIKTFMNFAADNAYRQLRVAPLEAIYYYPEMQEDDVGACRLGIPTDLIEIIQLRKKDESSTTGFTVFSAKSDIRSFLQDNTIKYDYQYYTRQGDTLLVYPQFSKGENYELYYYRRLPNIDARFTISFGNQVSDLLYYGATKQECMDLVISEEGSDVFIKDPDLENEITEVTLQDDNDTEFPNGWYLGRLASNWLRDFNEKVVLFGALAEMFTYLNEMDSAQLYAQRFTAEVEMLNKEDNMRKYMGGNIQTHFRSHLI